MNSPKLTTTPPMEYTEFFNNVKRAGKQTAIKLITPPLDWFEMSKVKPNHGSTSSTQYSNNSANAKTNKK